MANLDLDKLKAVQKSLERYMARYDPAHMARTEKAVDKVLEQNKTILDQFNRSVGSLDNKLNLTLADKTIAAIPKALTEEIGKIIDKIPNKTIVVDPGTEKIVKELKSVGSSFGKTIDSFRRDDRQTKEIVGQLKILQEGIGRLVAKDIVFPKQPDTIEVRGMDGLGKKLDDLGASIRTVMRDLVKVKSPKDNTKELISAIKELKIKIPKIEFPGSIKVDNFPPTKTAMPATHMSINSLSGSIHPTSTTVKTTLTTLPGYGVLDNRRAIVFYNNSDDTTVFIGGSTVTTSTGLPIEAKSFSPSFDSGPLQKWYGVTSSGTADIRCVEIPDLNIGR